jgi:methylenetetrahydrofolate--tRNA-(uracil-5-)-methyltransferase
MLGSLAHYIAHADTKLFQPMKANFGLMPPLEDGRKRNRSERASAYAERSASVLADFLENTQEVCA